MDFNSLRFNLAAPLSNIYHLQNQILQLQNIDYLYAAQESKMSPNSKKILKKRAKYNKIDDDIRLKLIEAVEKDGEMLKSVIF